MLAKSLLTIGAMACSILAVPAHAQMGGRAAIVLPDGAVKPLIQTACSACHSLGNITNSGHTREDWKTTVAMMLKRGRCRASGQS